MPAGDQFRPDAMNDLGAVAGGDLELGLLDPPERAEAPFLDFFRCDRFAREKA